MSKFITFQQKMSKAIKKWTYNTREELKFMGGGIFIFLILADCRNFLGNQ